MNMDNIFQIVYLFIGFVFGVLTSVIKINFEYKRQKFNLIKDWLSDIEEEFRINVEYQLNPSRAIGMWGKELYKEVGLKLLRSNARMFGLVKSQATPRKIRDSVEIVINKMALGQNLLKNVRMNKTEKNKINQDLKDNLDLHLSFLTDSIENANKIIAEHENNPLSMLFL